MNILVLGMHRSGTSLVTRLINLMGAHVGESEAMVGASSENPKGFWERQDVIACNDDILALAGCRWDSLAGWEERKPSALPAPLDQAMRGIVRTLNGHPPWVLKDPRLCLTLPYWLPAMESPVAVLVRRDPLEVAESLRIRNGFSLPHGLALWEYSWIGALDATRQLPRIFIDYAEAMADPVAAAERLYEGLKAHGASGLHPAAEAEVRAFVDAALYRSKPRDWAAQQTLTAHQRQLAEYKGEKISEEMLRLSPLAREMMGVVHEQREQASRLKEQAARLEDFERHVQRQSEELAQQHRHLLDYQGQLAELQRDKVAQQDKIAQLEPYVERYHVATSEIAFLRASRAWRIGSWLSRLGSRALGFLPRYRKSISSPPSRVPRQL